MCMWEVFRTCAPSVPERRCGPIPRFVHQATLRSCDELKLALRLLGASCGPASSTMPRVSTKCGPWVRGGERACYRAESL